MGTASGCATRTEWKNKFKTAAQRVYPALKPTLCTADAILILDFGLKSLRIPDMTDADLDRLVEAARGSRLAQALYECRAWLGGYCSKPSLIHQESPRLHTTIISDKKPNDPKDKDDDGQPEGATRNGGNIDLDAGFLEKLVQTFRECAEHEKRQHKTDPDADVTIQKFR